MTVLQATITIRKARLFLEQAKAVDAESPENSFSFSAYLEAAIIYARSSLDHLKKELAPKHKSRGYKRWHEHKLEILSKSVPLFAFMTTRRNFIIHERSQPARRRVSVESRMTIGASMSVTMTVTRPNGTTETHSSVPSKASDEGPTTASSTTYDFRFDDPGWSAEPAVTYVEKFIVICEQFISDAELQFP